MKLLAERIVSDKKFTSKNSFITFDSDPGFPVKVRLMWSVVWSIKSTRSTSNTGRDSGTFPELNNSTSCVTEAGFRPIGVPSAA